MKKSRWWVTGILVMILTVLPATAGAAPTVTASLAPTAMVGHPGNLWGRAAPHATVRSQVLLGSGWSTSQIRQADANGSYVIPLTYGATTPGTYRWRVTATSPEGTAISTEMVTTRTPWQVASAGTAPTGRTANVWGSMPGAGHRSVWTEVIVNGRWSRSQVRTTNASGGFVVPLTYGATTGGTYRWRVGVSTTRGTVYSEPFTFVRVGPCTITVEGQRVVLAPTASTATVVKSSGSHAVVHMVQRTTGCGIRTVFRDTTGRVGAAGVTPAATRRQSTNTTPGGTFTITEAFGIASNPGSKMPYRTATSNSYWVLDNDSAYYNQWRERGQGGFRTGPGERLYDYGSQYEYAAVINYNRWPAIRGKGGAIFLHIHGRGATAGCVSITRANMLTFLRTAHAGDTITIR